MAKSGHTLQPQAHFGEEAAPAILSRLNDMFAHEAGTRAGRDIEELHDMRVASRRLRAAMDIFAPCFTKPAYGPLQKTAARLTRSLGLVRDLDVMIEHLEGYRRDLPPIEQIGIDDLLGLLRAERDADREKLMATLNWVAHTGFRQRVKLVLGSERARASRAGKGEPDPQGTVREAAQHDSVRRVAELYGHARAVHDPARAEELHELRIAAKRLRYTLEIFRPCFAAGIDRCVDGVKTIQERIGQIHDRDTLIELLGSHLAVLAQREHGQLLSLVEGSPPAERLARLQGAILGYREADPRLGILILLGRTRDERTQRYTDFVGWWDRTEASGLRQDLYETIAADPD